MDDSLTGLVTGPNLLSYIGELTLHDHNDIADCNNLATRSADFGHHRYTQPEDWLQEYVFTMRYFGWELYDGAIFKSTRHDVSGSLANLLVESADNMKDSQQANALIDTLDTLKTNDPAMLSLDTETRQGESFQVVPARYDAKGNLHIALFKLELSVNVRRSRFLFWDWEKRSASLIQRKAYLRLDRDALDRRRALMKKKLEEQTMRRFDLRKHRP